MDENCIASAEFHPKLGMYWLMAGALILGLSIIGIPLLLLWVPVGLWVTQRYINNMSATLTSRKLIVQKGILTRTQNTVPLDKITDMALIQGPLMRLFGLHKLTVETAGQSGAGALISLTGILDVESFRTKVLAQKEALNQQVSSSAQTTDVESQMLMYLQQMCVSLQRIDKTLSQNKPI